MSFFKIFKSFFEENERIYSRLKISYDRFESLSCVQGIYTRSDKTEDDSDDPGSSNVTYVMAKKKNKENGSAHERVCSSLS